MEGMFGFFKIQTCPETSTDTITNQTFIEPVLGGDLSHPEAAVRQSPGKSSQCLMDSTAR